MEDTQDTSVPKQPETHMDSSDWYLESLVQMVNGEEVEFPITLFVKGLIISGNLVSGHKYFDGLGSQLKESLGGDSQDVTKAIAYLISPRDIYLQNTNESEVPPPQYIHLRAAKTFVPGQQPIPSKGTWWRGRLGSVDAFHFGSLVVSEAT